MPEESTRARIAVAAAVVGDVVGLVGSIASAADHVQTSISWRKASSAFASNSTEFESFRTQARELTERSISTASIYFFWSSFSSSSSFAFPTSDSKACVKLPLACSKCTLPAMPLPLARSFTPASLPPPCSCSQLFSCVSSTPSCLPSHMLCRILPFMPLVCPGCPKLLLPVLQRVRRPRSRSCLPAMHQRHRNIQRNTTI